MQVIITINFDEEGKVIDSKIEQSKDVSIEYAKWFNESCPAWTKDPEFNLMYLKRQQQYANDILRRQGTLLLNDVYTMLGMSRTKAGCVMGWVYNDNDSFVDFGLTTDYNSEFINGLSNKALLDFNVNGNILAYLED